MRLHRLNRIGIALAACLALIGLAACESPYLSGKTAAAGTSYAISYELDGGVNASANPASYTAADLPLPLAAASASGFNFVNWYSDSGLTTIYSFIPAGSASEVAVYARWTTATTYPVTYELDGGVNSNANPVNYVSADPNFVFKTPAKAGYAFGGWYTSSSFATSRTFIATGSTGAITVYAKWTTVSSSNYAMSASTTTSGTEAGFDLPGYYAVDGSDSTRWSSQKAPSASTPAWIALDLGQTRSIAGISVHWEAAPSGTWQIQSSADGNTWTAVDAAIAQPSGNGVTSTFSTAFTTRYVRILATGTQGTAGLSIYEITITGASRSLALPSTGE